jgi:putative ABC transport system permease protein
VIARLVLASARRRGRQLGLIAAAVAVAAATVTALFAFAGELRARVPADLSGFGPNLVIRPQVGGPDGVALAALAAVRAVPGVESAAAVREGRAAVRVERDPRGGLVVTLATAGAPATDDAGTTTVVAAERSLLAVHPTWRLDGRWPGAGEVLLGAALATRAGDVVTAALGDDRTHRVSGKLATGEALDHAVVVPLAAAADLQVDRIEVRAAAARLDEVRATLRDRLAGVEVEPVLRVSDAERALAARLAALLAAIALLTLALVWIAAGAAVASLVDARRSEIGLYLALGFEAARVRRLLALELLAACAVAAVVGELLGVGVASFLARSVLGGGEAVALRWGPLLGGPLVALVVVGLAAALPLRALAALDPARVLAGD